MPAQAGHVPLALLQCLGPISACSAHSLRHAAGAWNCKRSPWLTSGRQGDAVQHDDFACGLPWGQGDLGGGLLSSSYSSQEYSRLRKRGQLCVTWVSLAAAACVEFRPVLTEISLRWPESVFIHRRRSREYARPNFHPNREGHWIQRRLGTERRKPIRCAGVNWCRAALPSVRGSGSTAQTR